MAAAPITWTPTNQHNSEFSAALEDTLTLRCGRNYDAGTKRFKYWAVVKKNGKEIVFSTFTHHINPDSIESAKLLAEMAAAHELWKRDRDLCAAFGLGV